MKFTRTRPCAHCPFRVDVAGFLRRERAVEIKRTLLEGMTFVCHETVNYDEDDEGEETRVASPKEMACAGAMIAQMAAVGPSQEARIAERLGLADLTPFEVDPQDVGVLTLYEFADHHDPRDEDDEEGLDFCNVVGPDCENPAGFAVGGGAMENEDGPQCDWYCPACGEPCCESCRGEDDYDLCAYCAEILEEEDAYEPLR